jgi:hypothetical protein
MVGTIGTVFLRCRDDLAPKIMGFDQKQGWIGIGKLSEPLSQPDQMIPSSNLLSAKFTEYQLFLNDLTEFFTPKFR